MELGNGAVMRSGSFGSRLSVGTRLGCEGSLSLPAGHCTTSNHALAWSGRPSPTSDLPVCAAECATLWPCLQRGMTMRLPGRAGMSCSPSPAARTGAPAWAASKCESYWIAGITCRIRGLPVRLNCCTPALQCRERALQSRITWRRAGDEQATSRRRAAWPKSGACTDIQRKEHIRQPIHPARSTRRKSLAAGRRRTVIAGLAISHARSSNRFPDRWGGPAA